jgi:hypothetical protein
MKSEDNHEEKDLWSTNIWGWKWSMVALVIILLFLGMAVCRYLVIQPDRLIVPEDIEQDF